jgi:hypothetical protein
MPREKKPKPRFEIEVDHQGNLQKIHKVHGAVRFIIPITEMHRTAWDLTRLNPASEPQAIFLDYLNQQHPGIPVWKRETGMGVDLSENPFMHAASEGEVEKKLNRLVEKAREQVNQLGADEEARNRLFNAMAASLREHADVWKAELRRRKGGR